MKSISGSGHGSRDSRGEGIVPGLLLTFGHGIGWVQGGPFWSIVKNDEPPQCDSSFHLEVCRTLSFQKDFLNQLPRGSSLNESLEGSFAEGPSTPPFLPPNSHPHEV